MTILDATNTLYEWFQSHHSFETNRDLRKLIPIIENEEETTVALKLALADLEASRVVSSQVHGEKKYYVLIKPFESYTQNVELSSWTNHWIAKEINDFCELIEDRIDVCNANSIRDKDVRNTIHIINYYKNKLIEKENIISQLNDSPKKADGINDEDNDDGDKGKNKNPKK